MPPKAHHADNKHAEGGTAAPSGGPTAPTDKPHQGGNKAGKHPEGAAKAGAHSPAQAAADHAAAGGAHHGGGAHKGAKAHDPAAAPAAKGHGKKGKPAAKHPTGLKVPLVHLATSEASISGGDKTTLDSSPPAQPFVEGMSLGISAVDAITGEVRSSALDAASVQAVGADAAKQGDSFSLTTVQDLHQLEESSALGLTASVTAPVDGVKVGGSGGFDFSDDSSSSGKSIMYILDWSRIGPTKNVGPSAKLSDKALQDLKADAAGFRNKYGDYFVYSIAYEAKFTAVWKCTAQSSADISKFQSSVNASASAPGDIGGSGGFQNSLKSAAQANNVTVEVQYSTVGGAQNTHFDTGDPVSTFNSFLSSCVPAAATVLLHHYSQVDSSVPNTIDMPPTLYDNLSKVFSEANFVLLLNGLAPGSSTTRLKRRQTLLDLIKSIHAARTTYEHDAAALQKALTSLTSFRDNLLLLVERDDLVADQCALTHADFVKLFTIDHENDRGSWVKSSNGVAQYTLGKFIYTPDETTKYAVKFVTAGNGMNCHMGSVFLQQQVGAVTFPANTGIDGTVVGIQVLANWTDGTDGFWCIPPDNPLGAKTVKIEVKSEGSRGMDWGLSVAYIPTPDYDG
ncbi:hypothetical protein DENSPDRAFT_537018 [Dentipellis sp. KUC8613]|nr:hypothetical protein DENSPDRAFT_537018 [Dentipellis sp. KUC8613]